MSTLGAEFDADQREAEARAVGAEMYQQAARISSKTVDAVAAVLVGLDHNSSGRLHGAVAVEFARQMIADAALRHRQSP